MAKGRNPRKEKKKSKSKKPKKSKSKKKNQFKITSCSPNKNVFHKTSFVL